MLFRQDISYIQKYALSNICFIDDAFFRRNNITSYEFVGSCDALITDYSSIYFDYLLCGKPAAVIWEDIEEGTGADVMPNGLPVTYDAYKEALSVQADAQTFFKSFEAEKGQ